MDPAALDPAPSTVAELLCLREDDDAPGLHFAATTWPWRDVVTQSRRRAALASSLRGAGPFHVGVLLDNVPEYLLWLGAAALAGATVVGINPTRRGDELARDIRFTDCQLLVTDDAGAALLDGLDLDVPATRILPRRQRLVPGPARGRLDAGSGSGAAAPASAGPASAGPGPPPEVSPDDLLLLLFTSGTTGDPKAVRCTQGRLAAIAGRAAAAYGFERDDVCYCPMPLFHGNAIMALWAPALAVGASVAVAGRFSASRFLADVRSFAATRFTYVGKALAYVLATPEHADDGDNPLRQGFGTEASAPDRAIFERRFGCRLVEGYGSSEGGTSINVTPDTPPGSLGLPPPTDDVAVIDPGTGRECARARFDGGGGLANAGDAIGEIVSRTGARGFEGYYKNPDGDAERVRHHWYWSGDLGYRDEAGYFYFAGRSGDWLRRRLRELRGRPRRTGGRTPPRRGRRRRLPRARPPVRRPGHGHAGAAPGGGVRPRRLRRLPGHAAQPRDQMATTVGTAVAGAPLTATGKITKAPLRVEGWQGPDPVFWSPGHGALRYRLLTDDDRGALRAEFEEHGRSHLLGSDGGPALD